MVIALIRISWYVEMSPIITCNLSVIWVKQSSMWSCAISSRMWVVSGGGCGVFVLPSWLEAVRCSW